MRAKYASCVVTTLVCLLLGPPVSAQVSDADIAQTIALLKKGRPTGASEVDWVQIRRVAVTAAGTLLAIDEVASATQPGDRLPCARAAGRPR